MEQESWKAYARRKGLAPRFMKRLGMYQAYRISVLVAKLENEMNEEMIEFVDELVSQEYDSQREYRLDVILDLA